MSPTQRSLKRLRDNGWLAAVVEKWIPQVKRRHDLFGFIDIVAIKGNRTLAIQTTSGAHVADRIAKIKGTPEAALWLASPTREVHVHGWRKVGPRGKRKVWELREEAVSYASILGPLVPAELQEELRLSQQ